MNKILLIPIIGLLLLFSLTLISAVPSVTSTFNHSFLDLNDTPASYVGMGLRYVRVAAGENGLTFSLSSPSGGGNGTTYSSGTPDTLQVNNDLNTISQNFDGNFNKNLALRMPIAGDVNVYKIVNKLIAGTNETISCTGSDSNGTCTIDPVASPNFTNLTLSGWVKTVDINSSGIGTFVKINVSDFNATTVHIDQNVTVDKNAVIHQNLQVDGNITSGQFISLNGGINHSCTAICSDLNGTPPGSIWICVKVFTAVEVGTTCADTVTNAKNCICKD